MLSTQPTVLLLRTVGDACLVVSSKSITFCRIVLLCYLFDYIIVTAPADFLSKSQAKLPIYHFYPPSGNLHFNVYRTFCVSGSAYMLLPSCPYLSFPVLIISSRLPLRSTIVSFLQAYHHATYLVRLTRLVLRFCTYPFVDTAAPSARRKTYEALQIPWYFSILN
jgi:hypothetical protein